MGKLIHIKTIIFFVLIQFLVLPTALATESFEYIAYGCYKKNGYWGYNTAQCLANEAKKLNEGTEGYDFYFSKKFFMNLCNRLQSHKNFEYVNGRMKIDLRRTPHLIPIYENYYKDVIKVSDKISASKKKQEAEDKKRIAGKRAELEKLTGKKVEASHLSLADEERDLDQKIRYEKRRIREEKEKAEQVRIAEEQKKVQEDKKKKEQERYAAVQLEKKRKLDEYAKEKGCKGFYGTVMHFYMDRRVARLDPENFVGYMFESALPYNVVIKSNHIICFYSNPDITFAVEKVGGKFYGEHLKQHTELRLKSFGTFGDQQILIFEEL